MDDRYEEVLRQYDFNVSNVYRARGALLLETDKGIKLIRMSEYSKARVEYENKIMSYLQEQGYPDIDIYYPNRENELISENSQGDKYTVKNWYMGVECNLKEPEQIKLASKNLGKLHNILNKVSFAEGRTCVTSQDMPSVFEKHNRELKRVKSYIIDKKQRNEFEVRFLNSYERFFYQATEAFEVLQGMPFAHIKARAEESGTIVHGSYTYHNILVMDNEVATTNFEKADVGVQVFDLYYFMRKVMEKNNWDISLSNTILEEYQSSHTLDEGELELLYILMLYPEKFWKITNYYYNSKKSWISGRTIQKLVSIQQQEEQKNLFLKNLYRYCIM